MKITDKPANIVVPLILFVILSPGIVLTLPDEKSDTYVVIATHAAIFALVYGLLLTFFPQYY
jgi:hypothetical protein